MSQRSTRPRLLIAVCLCLTATAAPSARVDVTDTRLLAQPATSATHVAFVYAGDLWVARHDGTRRPAADDRRRRRIESGVLA